MGRRWLLASGVLALLVLTACAAGPNEAVSGGEGAGFWLGLWHGLITPVTLVISLFRDDVSIYEVVNNGNWYDVGFVVGLSLIWGAGKGSSSAARAGRGR